MEDNGDILKSICDEVINDPLLQPHDGETFCNLGARKVAQSLNCHDFDDLSLHADQMISIMESSIRWQKVNGSDATIHALGGGLAFAALTSEALGEKRGHIAAVYPVGMQRSGSYSCDVPLVANVGRLNGEEKVSQAFPPSRGMPLFFIWS